MTTTIFEEATGHRPGPDFAQIIKENRFMKHSRADYQLHIRAPDHVIPRDETVFLLRAQDKVAITAIRAWAAAAEALGAAPEDIGLALEVAAAMEAWPVKKVLDGPKT